jgi:UDP-glucuronate 4-epimerase
MRALVTGVAGFVGSTLAERLVADGWTVRGIDAFTPYYDVSVKWRNIDALLRHDAFELVEGHLEATDLRRLLADVDVVFHQAAQPGVRQSWADDFGTYLRANVDATQRLLQAVRERPVRRVVFASSSSVYGRTDGWPTPESARLAPHSPYGVTKLAAEQLCAAYAANFGVPTLALRYFTVYGPRQRPDMAIHRMIIAARSGEPFPMYGDGEQVRDFTYVDDVVEANVLAATAEAEPGTVLNIAGGSSTRLLDLVELVGVAVGREVAIDWRPAQPGDVFRTGGAIDRATSVLGWAPKVAIDEGVRRQVAWHLDTAT